MTASRNESAISLDRIVGKVLRRVRKERHFTQEQLALAMHMHPSAISLIERGLRSPNFRTLIRAASVMEVLPSEIVARLGRQLGEDWRNITAAAHDSPD